MAVRQHRSHLQEFTRFCRRYRELIMIVLTLVMSLAFLAFGMLMAINLESQHASWFQNGF